MTPPCKFNLFSKVTTVIICISFLFSCVNDLDTIQRVTFNEKSPDDVMREFNMFYNDSGYARVEIYSTLAET